MTTPLQITRYDRVVRRLMNLVGQPSIVTGVLEDVFPIIDLENLQPDAWRWAGWNICAVGDFVGGGLGNTTRISLDNPPDSGHVLVLTKFMVRSDLTQDLRGSLADVAARAPTAVANFRDTRTDPTTQVPVGQLFGEIAIAVPPEPEVMRLPVVNLIEAGGTNSPALVVDVPDGIVVLGPGTQFRIRAFLPDSGITASFWWRERPLDPAEFT